MGIGLASSQYRPSAGSSKFAPVTVKLIFDTLDANGDGALTFEEAKAALAGSTPVEQHKAVFEAFDADKNGQSAPAHKPRTRALY